MILNKNIQEIYNLSNTEIKSIDGNDIIHLLNESDEFSTIKKPFCKGGSFRIYCSNNNELKISF